MAIKSVLVLRHVYLDKSEFKMFLVFDTVTREVLGLKSVNRTAKRGEAYVKRRRLKQVIDLVDGRTTTPAKPELMIEDTEGALLPPFSIGFSP